MIYETILKKDEIQLKKNFQSCMTYGSLKNCINY